MKEGISLYFSPQPRCASLQLDLSLESTEEVLPEILKIKINGTCWGVAQNEYFGWVTARKETPEYGQPHTGALGQLHPDEFLVRARGNILLSILLRAAFGRIK